ncbi:hypothetical protein X976_5541 [Burkholderia pseudomallei MSHR7500]|nr:hypothetical protein X976_5541 [Burkholderia pseudomallei MSHR7500]KGU81999.1 hypothetical protein Y038_6038 [Burkholderia pseudomallei MSHR543]
MVRACRARSRLRLLPCVPNKKATRPVTRRFSLSRNENPKKRLGWLQRLLEYVCTKGSRLACKPLWLANAQHLS